MVFKLPMNIILILRFFITCDYRFGSMNPNSAVHSVGFLDGEIKNVPQSYESLLQIMSVIMVVILRHGRSCVYAMFFWLLNSIIIKYLI